MGKLADWCKDQPAWVSDALCRAASADDVTQADVDAVVARVSEAHGLPTQSHHPCESFLEDILRPTSSADDDILLCSIGPLMGVDRLASDQELKFAVDGVTLVFGDNASGKSGYARAARQLCHARIPGRLRGDVYVERAKREPITVAYCHQRRSGGEVVTETWKEGHPRPEVLGGITVLDTENARVYVEGENEILFLPPEVTCLTRLGKLYTLAAAVFQSEADALTATNGGPFGTLYKETTSTGALVRKLTTQTAKSSFPTELQLRDAAHWEPKLDEELRELESTIAQAPPVLQAKCNRLATALENTAVAFNDLVPNIEDAACQEVRDLIDQKGRTRRVADTLAQEQIGGHPIKATGNQAWKQLFLYARQFAAEADLRTVVQPFQTGDPCPLCQRPLDEESVKRLATFDVFVEGKASADAQSAAMAVTDRLKTLSVLAIKS